MEASLNQPASNKTSAKSNNSAFFYFESCQPPSLALVLLLIAYTVVLIMGLFGNLSLITIIFKKQREAQNVTNILIANLSLSDILVCIIIPFTAIYTLMDHWIFGDTMCKLTSYMQSVSISVSIFSLVLIAIERYQLTANPRGWKPGVSHAYWGITLIWLISLLLSIPLFLSYHLTDEPFQNLSLPTDIYTQRVACVENWPSKMNQLLFSTSLFMFQYFVPLGFILICYLKIVICLRKRNRKVDWKRENESRLSDNKRINTMLISIMVTFGACWLTLNIFNVIFD